MPKEISFATEKDAKGNSLLIKTIVPSEWLDKEMTVRIFQRLVKEWDGKDKIRLFSILSGIHFDGIVGSKDKHIESAFYECIRFIYEPPPDFPNLPLPEFFPSCLGDQLTQIKIPKNLGRLTLGQNIAIRQAMDEVLRSITPETNRITFNKDFAFEELISYATSVYMQPLITGKQFDDVLAKEIEEEVLEMPIIQIYPIAFFFLNQLSSSGRKHTINLSQLLTKVTKSGKRLQGWLKLNFYSHTKIWHLLTVTLRGLVAIQILYITKVLTM